LNSQFGESISRRRFERVDDLSYPIWKPGFNFQWLLHSAKQEVHFIDYKLDNLQYHFKFHEGFPLITTLPSVSDFLNFWATEI
jgi:hypothetical protein